MPLGKRISDLQLRGVLPESLRVATEIISYSRWAFKTAMASLQAERNIAESGNAVNRHAVHCLRC